MKEMSKDNSSPIKLSAEAKLFVPKAKTVPLISPAKEEPKSPQVFVV